MASFLGTSIKGFPLPPLEGAGAIHKTYSFLSLRELSPTPLCKVCVICEKSKFGLRESSLSALEHSLCYLLPLEVKPPRWLGVTIELPRF
jgi:hypothetical protein